MKTIAVVRLPYYEVSDHKEIREQLESRLPDYSVLLDFSTANEKLTIDFFSPELQAGKKLNEDNFEFARKIAESAYPR